MTAVASVGRACRLSERLHTGLELYVFLTVRGMPLVLTTESATGALCEIAMIDEAADATLPLMA